MRGTARRARGFTLVELLVAIFALSLLAVLSWRGLDGMVRAQTLTEQRADEVLTLQTGLAQWNADLEALMQLPQLDALDWNGRVLRLTRRGTASPDEGVRVVGWTRRADQWLRWQSPPLTTRGDVEAAWQQADIWSQNPGDELRRGEVAIAPLADWQIFFFRGNSWTNPLSSDAQGGTPAPAAPPATPPLPGVVKTAVVPDGVRLVLELPRGHALNGRIVRDWVHPSVGGGSAP